MWNLTLDIGRRVVETERNVVVRTGVSKLAEASVLSIQSMHIVFRAYFINDANNNFVERLEE